MAQANKAKCINVLIVEDSLLLAQKLKTILAGLAVVNTATHAKNYEEAVDMLGIVEPDLIILDLQLPGKNGIELLTYIRMKKLHSKVVIFTNHSDPYYRNLCIQLGADYFLDKSSEFQKIPLILEYYQTTQS